MWSTDALMGPVTPPLGPPAGAALSVVPQPALCRRASDVPAADRPVLLGDRSYLRSARAVRLGRAGVVLNQVASRSDVKDVGHRRLLASASRACCSSLALIFR